MKKSDILLKLIEIQENNYEIWTNAAALKRDTNVSMGFEAYLSSIENSCELTESFVKRAIDELKRMEA